MNNELKIFIIGLCLGLMLGVSIMEIIYKPVFIIDLNETIMVDRMYELMEKDKPINYINKTKTVPADFIGPLQKGTIREVKA